MIEIQQQNGHPLMNSDVKKCFAVGLRLAIERKGVSQKKFIEGIASGVTLSKILNQRAGTSDEMREKLAERAGMSVMDIVVLGQQALLGKEKASSDNDQQSVDRYHKTAPPTVPTDHIDPDDFVEAAVTFSRMYRKSNDRLKMWRAVFDHAPNPMLIIRDKIVVWQNTKSRAWGLVAGDPLCDGCIHKDGCPGPGEENDICAIDIAERRGSETVRYNVIDGSIKKTTATPMYLGEVEYIIVVCVEIDSAEVINMVTHGAPVRPNRRKEDM